jgi:hypothetical protein
MALVSTNASEPLPLHDIFLLSPHGSRLRSPRIEQFRPFVTKRRLLDGREHWVLKMTAFSSEDAAIPVTHAN